MKILHIVAGVPPGGGMAESVPALCRHLRQLGHEVTLATLDGPLSEAAQAAGDAGVRLVRFAPSFPRALYFSWQMLRGLPALACAADAVHVHGAWTFPVWWGCRCALQARKPLVMSPRGALNPVYLTHSAWKKRLVGWLDRACLRRAAAVHVTSETERGWVAAYCDHGVVAMASVKTGERRIVVIPNGVALEPRNTRNARNCEKGETRTVLYLGRLHPLKGLELLVEAWGLLRPRSGRNGECKNVRGAGEVARGACDGGHARAEPGDGGVSTQRRGDAEAQGFYPQLCDHWVVAKSGAGEGWRLVIAGPDEQGTLKALKTQVARLGLEESVVFAGPVYGAEKERLLRAADVFVLPSRSENFGIAVAEALACGVPVVCTKGAPWEELLGYCDHAVVAMASVKTCAGRAGARAVHEMGDSCGKEITLNAQVGERPSGAGLLPSSLRPPGGGENEGTRCGWWVDVGVEPLAEALREAMGLTDEERRAMGENGRRLVERKYRWERVAQAMCGVYRRGE